MMLPPLDRVRAGARQTRDVAGRIGTACGTAALASALFTPEALAVGLPAAAVAAGGGYAMSIAPAGDAAPGWLRVMYCAPAATLAAEAIVFQLKPGLHWWEFLLTIAWGGLTWWLRPSLQARDWATEPGEEAAALYEQMGSALAVPAATEVDMTGTLPERLATWWTAHAGLTGGPAPGTHLERIAAAGPRDFAAHIVADVPGQPVPDISIARLSALMDIPEELFAVSPVPGSGAGRRRLRVGTAAATETFADLWTQKIAPAAMPGTRVIAVRTGTISKEISDSDD